MGRTYGNETTTETQKFINAYSKKYKFFKVCTKILIPWKLFSLIGYEPSKKRNKKNPQRIQQCSPSELVFYNLIAQQSHLYCVIEAMLETMPKCNFCYESEPNHVYESINLNICLVLVFVFSKRLYLNEYELQQHQKTYHQRTYFDKKPKNITDLSISFEEVPMLKMYNKYRKIPCVETQLNVGQNQLYTHSFLMFCFEIREHKWNN